MHQWQGLAVWQPLKRGMICAWMVHSRREQGSSKQKLKKLFLAAKTTMGETTGFSDVESNSKTALPYSFAASFKDSLIFHSFVNLFMIYFEDGFFGGRGDTNVKNFHSNIIKYLLSVLCFHMPPTSSFH